MTRLTKYVNINVKCPSRKKERHLIKTNTVPGVLRVSFSGRIALNEIPE